MNDVDTSDINDRNTTCDRKIQKALDVSREMSSFFGGEPYMLDCPLKPTVVVGIGPAGTASVLYLKHLFTSYTSYMSSSFISTLGIVFRCMAEQKYLEASCGTAWLESDEKLSLKPKKLDPDIQNQIAEYITDGMKKCSLRHFWGEQEQEAIQLILFGDTRKNYLFTEIQAALKESLGSKYEEKNLRYSFYPIKCDVDEIRRWSRIIFAAIALRTNLDWDEFPWFEVQSLLFRQLFLELNRALKRRPTEDEVCKMLEKDQLLADQIWESDILKKSKLCTTKDCFDVAEFMTINLKENVVKPYLIRYGPGFVAEYLRSESSQYCIATHINRLRTWFAETDVSDTDKETSDCDIQKLRALDSVLYAFQENIINMALTLKRIDYALRTVSDFFLDAPKYVCTVQEIPWSVDPYSWITERQEEITDLLQSDSLTNIFFTTLIEEIYVWSGSDFSDVYYKCPIRRGVSEMEDGLLKCLERIFGSIIKEE